MYIYVAAELICFFRGMRHRLEAQSAGEAVETDYSLMMEELDFILSFFTAYAILVDCIAEAAIATIEDPS